MGNAADLGLADSVGVDLDVEFEVGGPGIVGKRREGGFEEVYGKAGAGPTGLGGRGLGGGEELGVPDPAGSDPFGDPGSEAVGVGRAGWVVGGLRRVASGSGLHYNLVTAGGSAMVGSGP